MRGGSIQERLIFVETLFKNDKYSRGFYQRTINIRGDLSKNDKYSWRFIKER